MANQMILGGDLFFFGNGVHRAYVKYVYLFVYMSNCVYLL